MAIIYHNGNILCLVTSSNQTSTQGNTQSQSQTQTNSNIGIYDTNNQTLYCSKAIFLLLSRMLKNGYNKTDLCFLFLQCFKNLTFGVGYRLNGQERIKNL